MAPETGDGIVVAFDFLNRYFFVFLKSHSDRKTIFDQGQWVAYLGGCMDCRFEYCSGLGDVFRLSAGEIDD